MRSAPLIRARATALLFVAFVACRRDSEQPTTATELQADERPVIELREVGQVHAGKQAQFVLTARRSSGEAMRLEPIGGEMVHVVAVRKDLSWLTHAHPRESDAGEYTFDLTFPKQGRYAVFAVLIPAGGERQTVRREVVASDAEPEARPELAASPRDQRFGKYDIRLTTEPAQPVSRSWSTLTFHLSRDSAPVTDLREHVDSGHLVILDASAEHFVYAHSTDGEALRGVRARAHLPVAPPTLRPHEHAGDERGPDVQFHALFPAAGRYKIWAEFEPGTEHVTAEFVIDVVEGKGELQ